MKRLLLALLLGASAAAELAAQTIVYEATTTQAANGAAGAPYYISPRRLKAITDTIVAGGLTDGDKGDITLSSSATVWTIDPGSVSLVKMANMATASLLGRNTAGTGAPEVLSAATAKSLLSLNNVENTALSTWAGSANLTTLGDAAAPSLAITSASDGIVLAVRRLNSSQTANPFEVQTEANAMLAAIGPTGNITGVNLTATGQTYNITSDATRFIKAGTGSPESAVTGGIGSVWLRTDGGSGTSAYIKESGTGNTGWVAVAPGGGSQNLFETIAISGQSNVVADSTTDTLTLVAGANITLTTNAGTDAITIAASAGAAGDSISVDGVGVTDPNFDDGGDINFTDTGNTITATVKADSVALGTDTTGDYVATITGDSEITVSGAGTEGRAATLAIASSITRDTEIADMVTAASAASGAGEIAVSAGANKALNFTATPSVTSFTATTGNIGSLVFEGATADEFETTIAVTDPTADRTLTLPNASGTFALVAGDIGAATATTPSANDNDTSVATTAYAQAELTAYASDTVTFTNKTFDAAATGNVLKAKAYIYLTHPHLADGTGATIGTTATAIGYGHATFTNSADQAANYVEYYFQVPEDIDTSVALRARLKVLLGNTDTATHRYVLSSVSVADSAVPTASTLANAINVDFAGDASGANGDVETSAWTTLTSWAGALTAGQTWRIRLARDGDATEDASTVNSTELGLVLEYGITQ